MTSKPSVPSMPVADSAAASVAEAGDSPCLYLEACRGERAESSSSAASTCEGCDTPCDVSCPSSDEREDDSSVCDSNERHTAELEVEADTPANGKSIIALVTATVLCGCASQAPYEVLNSRDKGCAPLLSLVEHVFGIVASLGALRQPRRLPWSLHLGLGAVNAGYSLLLSAAFSTSLPTTVLVAMKNGNLVASMLLGLIVLRHRYARRQYAGVLIISAGLVATSLSGVRAGSATATPGSAASSADAWLGILYLAGALLCRAASGMLQEISGRGFGASVSELLLYRSALGLPLICMQWPSILKHAMRWSHEPEISGLVWPSPWLLLVAWIAADYGMKVCIARLIDRTSSLASALTLTLQRFISFVISAAVLSQEPITSDVCFGVVTVLGGTLLYVTAQKTPSSSSKKTN